MVCCHRILIRSSVLICLTILIQSTSLLSQTGSIEHEQLLEIFNQERITVADGISSGSATCFLKDSKGFMWIGTNRGLNRYDGYNFRSYAHDEFDTNSLSADFMTCLCEDRDGMIWIGTLDGGLNKYNPELEIFTHYPTGEDDLYRLRGSWISALCTDPFGDIWFAAQGTYITESVYKINIQTEKIQCIISDTINPGLPASIHCHALLLDSEDNMWVGIEEGFAMYDSTDHRLVKFNLDIYRNSDNSREGTVLYEDSQGIIWVGSWGGGLYQFDRNTCEISRHDQVPYNPAHPRYNKIAAIVEDNSGSLIIRTAAGIDYLDRQENCLIRWKFHGYDRSINYSNTRSLFWDNSGLLWFSVPPGKDVPAGIYKLSLRNKKFYHIKPGQLNFKSLDRSWISSVFQDTANNIWVGGSNIGLTEIVTSQSPYAIKHYPADPENTNSIYSNNISAIHQDKRGVMWIGNWDEGVLNKLDLSGNAERFMRYMPENLIITKTPYIPKLEFIKIRDVSFTSAGSMKIHEDTEGHFWIGRGTGLELLDRATGAYYSYDLDSGKHEYHDLPVVTSISEDEAGCLWIGTMHQGLFKIIPPVTINQSGRATGKRTISYRYDPDMPKDLGDLMLTSLCIPEKNKDIEIWIGTVGGGLIGLKQFKATKGAKPEQIVRYSESDGLADNSVFGILEDGRGNLWLSTENGLSRFNPKSRDFNTYNETDGLPVQQFHWLSCHKGRNGLVFFGGRNGLVAFYPDSIPDNSIVPPVVITDFKLFNKPVPIGKDSPLKKSITETNELQLSYRENHLTFEFAALNYVTTELNQYRYMMYGLDEDWIDAGSQRIANYTSLKHVKYTFKVMGSNNDGVWNEEGASIGIIIKPPPWLAWWAYMIYGLVLTGILLLYRRYLLTRAQLRTDLEIERVEKEKVEELDHLKSRFFANISHEFRTPLTLLMGPIEDLQKKQHRLEAGDRRLLGIMKRNASRLQQLINQLLDLSKLETGKMKLKVQEGDLAGFVRTIVLSFLSLAESKKIDYQHEIPDLSQPVFYDADKIEKILTNLISNALKFTPRGGKIRVALTYINSDGPAGPSSAEISVRDTGEGIPREMIDKIFDRFFQVSSSDTRESEGTGIGLSLTKELVNIYRGEIKVESKPGEGSDFKVVLPVSRDSFGDDEIDTVQPGKPEMIETGTLEEIESVPAEPEPQEEEITEGNKVRPVILIVEDNADLRNYISQHLQNDYQIQEAENGKEGIAKATECIPDLVITDLMMPEMDGMEMCSRLKDDERTSHIPIIMLTAKADRESKLEGLETGADDYIIKPFDSNELQVRIKNLIMQRKKLQEQFNRNFFIDDRITELKSADERFLEKAKDIIENHISDPDFNIDSFSQHLGISRMQLYRKLQGMANQSPGEFIQKLRLKHSLILLSKGFDNIAQIAYQVGFSDSSYYARCFRKLYGVSPSEYANGQRKPSSAASE